MVAAVKKERKGSGGSSGSAKYDPAEPTEDIDDEARYNEPYNRIGDDVLDYSPNIDFISGNICNIGKCATALWVAADGDRPGKRPVLSAQLPPVYFISGRSRRDAMSIDSKILITLLFLLSLTITSRPKTRLILKTGQAGAGNGRLVT